MLIGRRLWAVELPYEKNGSYWFLLALADLLCVESKGYVSGRWGRCIEILIKSSNREH